ncbi:MAG: hypothetical protein HQL24_04070 [Candidatus Omnitrophica bacterium]|nr:hypothetical protein [Candidatus Omnitrophota bacterium]
MKCLYCKEEIIKDNSSEEHVFPKAFGCPDNWVLDCVCRNCNVELGATIDRQLAGNSIEGIWRLQKIGSRSKKPIRQNRIRINIPDEDRFGEFRGVILFADFLQTDSLYLPPQILICDIFGKKKSILIEDMSDEEIKNIKGKYDLFAYNSKEYKKAVQRLKKLGKKIDETKNNHLSITAIKEDGKLEVEVRGGIDLIICRAIAKIAFNYFAKVHGAGQALDSKFDTIRNFVRTGVMPKSKIVNIEKGHILADETDRQYSLEGHIFTIENKGNYIISKIALTNMFGFYYIVKIGDLGPIWRDIKKGHAYSLKSGKIIELFSPTFLILNSKLKRIRV